MPSTPPAPRDPWFENAKMALVTLVAIGHSWTLLPHAGVLVEALADGLAEGGHTTLPVDPLPLEPQATQ